MNIFTIIAAAILIINVLNGLRRGLIASLFSTFSFIIAVFAALAVTPALSSAVIASPVYDSVNTGVQAVLFSREAGGDENGSGSGQGLVSRDALQLTAYQPDEAGQGTDDQGSGMSDGSQEKFIEGLPLPDYLKDALAANNNINIYDALGVNAFQTYVSSYLSRIIIRVLVFIIVFAAVSILLKLIGLALDLVDRIPVLGAMNRVGGLIFGIINGLFILWLICSAATVFGGTQLSSYIYEGISGNPVLSALYNNNILMNFLTRLEGGSL